MTAQAAFAALGGEAVSGSTGAQGPPPNGYDYPVKGTGNPDDVADTKTVWWQVCIKTGFVTSTQRAPLEQLPGRCPSN